MRDCGFRRWRVAVLIVVLALIAGGVWAQNAPTPVWPTYHGDMLRRGLNESASEVGNPASLNLIWVFPRATADKVDESLQVVDNRDTVNFGKHNKVGSPWSLGRDSEAWGATDEFPNSTDHSFWWLPAVPKPAAVDPDVAYVQWLFPSTLPRGYYQVWVWIPPLPEDTGQTPSYTYTIQAEYHIWDDGGETVLRFDQSDGGTWQPLSTKPFSFFTTKDLKVVLTNQTDDLQTNITAYDIRVAADAIKFVPTTGQEIYSSPVSAEANYILPDPDNPSGTPLFNGKIPVVYLGTVEQPLSKDESALDMGAVYCVNSITPDNKSIDDFSFSDSEKKKRELIAAKLGTSIWRYPRDFRQLTESNPPDALEGPIEGGIYSSPSLAKVGSDLVCYITGSDRQVYALNAETGKLIWKGPGITRSEGDTASGWSSSPADSIPQVYRNDAFGGRCRWIACDSGGGAFVEWNFGKEDRQLAGEQGDGWSYTVYAWIPTAIASIEGNKPRASDALYSITYTVSGGNTETTTVKVDQSIASNQGRWVKLGSYFAVEKVSLSNKSSLADASNYVVVADAMMIVPETVGAFTYSTPATNVDLELENYNQANVSDLASEVYAASANGRLLGFDAKVAGDPVKRMGRVKWIYPKVRTSLSLSPPGGGDDPSMGETGGSPAYFAKKVYIESLSGKVYCVNSDDGTLKWEFEDTSTASSSDEAPEPGSSPGFTSSITVDKSNGGQLFVGSTQGTFYCLDAVTGTPRGQYPVVDPSTKKYTGLPYGAFRYSTPNVADVNAMHRVWACSTDGHIYTMGADSTLPLSFLRRQYQTTDSDTGNSARAPGSVIDYWEPSVLAPIQAAPAFDGFIPGLKETQTMYVGDMNGILHWFRADNGKSDWLFDPVTGTPDGPDKKNYKGWQCEGELFSSPNVTTFTLPGSASGVGNYIYVGCADGRLYAFSQYGGAWGGSWAGGYWPFSGEPNDRSQAVEKLAPDTDIQVDVFNPVFFANSSTRDPGDTATSGKYEVLPGTAFDDNWILSQEMKMPTGLADPPSDADLKTKLLDEAQQRRSARDTLNNKDHLFPNIGDRMSNTPVYLEWGENLNIIIWNLPPLEFLTGRTSSSAGSNFTFSFQNTSSGSSAGSTVRLAGRVILKEYTLLKAGTEGIDPDTGKNVADPLQVKNPDGSMETVKRCYALAQIYIDPKKNPPFSPGPGWVLVAEIKTKLKSTDKTPITQRIPLARLMTGSPPKPLINKESGEYQEQLFGINNPLAIRDDQDRIGLSAISLAWPRILTGTNPYQTYRNDPEAHFNGNGILNDDGTFDTGIVPFLNMLFVTHGTSSREAWLGIMDRSASGCKATGTDASGVRQTAVIDKFRIDSGELGWRGGPAAISNSGGVQFPWEFGPGSVDYPNISKTREDFRKATDDDRPALKQTTLPPVLAVIPIGSNFADYNTAIMRPETIYASVEVPRFQPANLSGYTKTMPAYIDSNPNNEFDSGDSVYGRPTTYQEVYRKFRMGLKVPGDPKVEVQEQLIDIGRAPHGLGDGMFGPLEFNAFNPNPEVQKWFKDVTIKNAGNVNLPNMYIGREVQLFSDQSSPVSPVPAGAITSSLDWSAPLALGLAAFKAPPFTTMGVGYTLSKARVGDPDPTLMTIPDRRKWDIDYQSTVSNAQALFATSGWVSATGEPRDQPLPVRVGLRIPLSQPIGTYQSYDGIFKLPYVPVFCDLDGDGALDIGLTPKPEPVAQTSFQMKATVREAQITGGVTPTMLPQVDVPWDASGNAVPIPRVGDSTPAAFRDAVTGDVHLYWSSNRMYNPGLYPSNWLPGNPQLADFANAPWFINRADLKWEENGSRMKGWQTLGADPDRWWVTPTALQTPLLPDFGGSHWPSQLLGSNSSLQLMEWQFGGPSGLPSVKHHSPVIAENLDVAQDAGSGRTWLAWVGVADLIDPTSNKVSQEHRIFYTDATGGDVTSGRAQVQSIPHDPVQVKRCPSVAVGGYTDGVQAKDRMWMFWQGGNDGRWSICYSNNDAGLSHASGEGTGQDLWSDDAKVRMPDCLASVSSPNAVLRHFWSASSADPLGRQFIDLVYSGSTKLDQSPDVLLGRYMAITKNDANYVYPCAPSEIAQPMPRVFSEKLERDSKYGFYTSRHLAWIRPDKSSLDGLSDAQKQTVLADHAGRVEHLQYENFVDGILSGMPAQSRDPFRNLYNLPYVWVKLPDGSILSATEMRDTAGNLLPPQIDEATGVYVYDYSFGTDADSILKSEKLGQTMIDYSAGIVRFTKALPEVPDGNGGFNVSEIFADYTPQTWKITTDKAVNNSPRAFIERTKMYRHATVERDDPNPGLGQTWAGDNAPPAPVDRLWVFWRKAGTGIESSTIFFTTYRVGVDLAKLITPTPGAKYQITAVDGALGPWEIDGTGSKVYFTEIDERYRSLLKSGSADVLPNGPGPITITYKATEGNNVTTGTVVASDVFWQMEVPEQSLLGFSGDSNVNEGSIYAFADPNPKFWDERPLTGGTWKPVLSSKIWVFWTSTRGGTSDLFWETLSPDFAARKP
ncbi:MAG: PQQ-binding-like beta-propeller repeat protein [Armatimonadetes bacterium]|nr:PQQ-binding-like beta-propeller repeat protein [Armatimonadota bacterium]